MEILFTLAVIKLFRLEQNNYILFFTIFRVDMSSETTVEDISVSHKELNTGMECQCYFYKNCVLGVLESQLESNSVSQETLDECLLIGLSSIPTQSQHHIHGLAAVELLLNLGAKWDGSTLFQMDRMPYHIIMQCSSDHHRLLNLMIKCKRFLHCSDESIPLTRDTITKRLVIVV